eukprot:CAMPEP_0175137630 /NCGR_PEP_ID=MMETSP0087-20121206/9916_1 /TAXON_ID=136419 /ORGANISM="Unknown Unknown, Strain D1" /LENGTH=684 /DNA_ID=CAMNT_0016420475 /DNA_START=40 /DNA_END=2091 /DNA_ORIENTATION=-
MCENSHSKVRCLFAKSRLHPRRVLGFLVMLWCALFLVAGRWMLKEKSYTDEWKVVPKGGAFGFGLLAEINAAIVVDKDSATDAAVHTGGWSTFVLESEVFTKDAFQRGLHGIRYEMFNHSDAIPNVVPFPKLLRVSPNHCDRAQFSELRQKDRATKLHLFKSRCAKASYLVYRRGELNELVWHMQPAGKRFHRFENNDWGYIQGERKMLAFPASGVLDVSQEPQVAVYCADNGFVNLYSRPLPLHAKQISENARRKRAQQAFTKALPNVQIIVMDCVARFDFLARARKTTKLLEQWGSGSEYDVFQFFKYSTSNGVVTLKNVPSLLFGCWPCTTCLVNLFKDRGYVTAMIGSSTYFWTQDVKQYDVDKVCAAPDYLHCLFEFFGNQYPNGFSKRSFYSPFFSIFADDLEHSGDMHCAGQHLGDQYTFQYARELWDLHLEDPKFAYIHLESTHNTGHHLLHTLDSTLANWLERSAPNTITLLMGDHGIPFNWGDNFPFGRFEAVNPAFFVITPKKLLDAKTRQYLKSLENELVSHRDVYRTLARFSPFLSESNSSDVLGSQEPIDLFDSSFSNRANRTCNTLGTDPQFCIGRPQDGPFTPSQQQASSLLQIAVQELNVRSKDAYHCHEVQWEDFKIELVLAGEDAATMADSQRDHEYKRYSWTVVSNSIGLVGEVKFGFVALIDW